MAARRSCVNSLWSGSERVRIGERLKATLAGVLELEVLRCKHLEMVDAALEDRAPAGADGAVPGPGEESGTPESSATSRRQQVSQHGSLHAQIIKYECRNDRHLPKSHPPTPHPWLIDRFLPLPGGFGCATVSDGARDHPSTERSFYTA